MEVDIGLAGEACRTPNISLSAHLPYINSIHQRCSADSAQGKSSLLTYWARTKLFVGRFGLCTSPRIFCIFAPDQASYRTSGYRMTVIYHT